MQSKCKQYGEAMENTMKSQIDITHFLICRQKLVEIGMQTST
jgi:hypothetical protein